MDPDITEAPEAAPETPATEPAAQEKDPWLSQFDLANEHFGTTLREGKLKVRAPDGSLGTIPDGNRAKATAQGYKILGPDQRVRGTLNGQNGTVPPEKLRDAIEKGFKPMSVDESRAFDQRKINKESFDMPGTAAAAHLANGLGFGVPLAAAKGLGEGRRAFEAAVQAHSPEELKIQDSASKAFRQMFGEGYNPDDHDPKKNAAWLALKDRARAVQGTPEPVPQENDYDRFGQATDAMTEANRKASFGGELLSMVTGPQAALMKAARVPAAAAAAERAAAIGARTARLTGSWRLGQAAERAVTGAVGETAASAALSAAQAPAKLSEQPLGPEAFWHELGSAGLFAATSAVLGAVGGGLGSLIRTRNMGFRDSPDGKAFQRMVDAAHEEETAALNEQAKKKSAAQWARDNQALVDQHPEIKKTIAALDKARTQADVRKYTQAEVQLRIDLAGASDAALGKLLPSRIGEAQSSVGKVNPLMEDMVDAAAKDSGVPGAGQERSLKEAMAGAHPGSKPGETPPIQEFPSDLAPGEASGQGWLASKAAQEDPRLPPWMRRPQESATPEPPSGAATNDQRGARAQQADMFPRNRGGVPADEHVNSIMSDVAKSAQAGKAVSTNEIVDRALEVVLGTRDADGMVSVAGKLAQQFEKIGELSNSGTDALSKRVGYAAVKAAKEIGDRLDNYLHLEQLRQNVGLPQSPILEAAGVESRGILPGSIPADPAARPRVQSLEGKLAGQREQAGRIGSAFQRQADQAAAVRKSTEDSLAAAHESIGTAPRQPGLGEQRLPPRPVAAAASAPGKMKIMGGNITADIAHSVIGAAMGGMYTGGLHGAVIGGGGTFATRLIRRFFGAKLHAAVKDLPDLQPQFAKDIDAKINSIFGAAKDKAKGIAAGAPGKVKAAASEVGAATADVADAAGSFVKAEGPTLAGRMTASNFGDDHDDKGTLPEAARAKADAIAKLMADPKTTETQMQERLLPLKDMDPKLIEGTVQHFMERLRFLNDHAPKLPPQTPLSGHTYLPSTSAAGKFARYVAASEDPVGVLMDGIKSGNVWPETNETIQSLFPALGEHLRTQVLQRLIESGEDLPYARRQALASAFGGSMNRISNPKFVSWYNQTMAEQAQARADRETQPGDAGGYMPKRKIDSKAMGASTPGQKLGA